MSLDMKTLEEIIKELPPKRRERVMKLTREMLSELCPCGLTPVECGNTTCEEAAKIINENERLLYDR